MDYTFASSYLSTKASSLLTKEQFLELKKVSDENFILKLHSFGYGLKTQDNLITSLIKDETLILKKELLEVVLDENLIMFFFTKYDLVNLRSYLKEKLFQIKRGPFEEAGFLSEKDLENVFTFDDLTFLIEPYKTLLLNLYEQTFNSVNELVIYLQQKFQTLLFEEVYETKDEPLKIYFQMSTDINNLITLLRFRKLGLSKNELQHHLLGHGTLEVDEIINLLNKEDEEIIEKYSNLYITQFVKPLEKVFLTNDYSFLEIELLDLLLKEIKPFEVDVQSSASIIRYVILKQIELIDLRRIYHNREAKLMVELKDE